MSLKLYFAPGASSLAPLVALEEAGATYDGERLLLADSQQRHPDFLAINPRGRVPVLVADGQVITENVAILTAIAQRFPTSNLLPFETPSLLARSYELIGWFGSGVHVAFAEVFRPERFTDDEAAKAALKTGGRRNVLLAFEEIEAILRDAPGGWLVGDRFTAVDPYALVFWRWAGRLNIQTEDYPAFTAHASRLLQRPSVQRAIARETGSAPVQLAAARRA
jgi:glutathione S-transferase